MLITTLIGNLGRDAEVKSADGRQFVTFTIASTESYKKESGEREEKTQWVSCTMNQVSNNLLPYLKKGAKVCVVGRMSAKLYSSAKDRCLKSGLNLSVMHLELVSTNIDEVPRELYDNKGVAHIVTKHYYVQPTDPKKAEWPATMQDAKSNLYEIVNGFVTLSGEQQATEGDNEQAEAEIF